LWVAKQCEGIASGLFKIHGHQRTSSLPSKNLEPPDKIQVVDDKELYGRHGDIKPENILWFRDSRGCRDGGTLIISDFGLGKLNSRNSRPGIRNSALAASPTYRAPETDLKGGLISRSFDIWTLGCVYLEFIAWILGGWDFVFQFSNDRKSNDTYGFYSDTFFEIVTAKESGKTAAMVKPVVTHVRSLKFL
jgi:serine/threonine protein kinase